MSEQVKLTAKDGHELVAYVARPAGDAIGSLVLVQEIFGLNAHIRHVCDGYAKDGFLVVAPALFDRYERGVDLTYEGADLARAFELYQKLEPKAALLDIAAAFDYAKSQEAGAVGVIGYCFGGFMSWLTACDGPDAGIHAACCVGYYAGGIGKVADHEPKCPVMLHFGTEDSHIGQDQVDAVRSAHPDVQIFLYEGAGHGFNRSSDESTADGAAARLARGRSVEFLKKHVAAG